MSGPVRELREEAVTWRAVEAWRGRAGDGLCYFLRLEGDVPASDDRADRRAVLAPGVSIAALDDQALFDLLEGAARLTVTEHRIVDGEGTPWLVQSRGPVWAEGEATAGQTGRLYTALDGTGRRLVAPDGRGDTGGLLEALARALKGDGEESGAVRASGPDGI